MPTFTKSAEDGSLQRLTLKRQTLSGASFAVVPMREFLQIPTSSCLDFKIRLSRKVEAAGSEAWLGAAYCS
jgi:hypothetical protein